MKESKYKLTIEELEKYFLDEEKVFGYGDNITPKYIYFKPFSRLGSHIIYVEKYIVEDAIKFAKYNKELTQLQINILQRGKVIEGKDYIALVDHKTDQTREITDYIISQSIKTQIYVYAPDNLFWFFHDMGHGFLAGFVDNFYDNVYGRGEMLVNIFAAIKLKKEGYFNRKNILSEVVEKGYKYPKEAKKYFENLMEKLEYSDDIPEYI